MRRRARRPELPFRPRLLVALIAAGLPACTLTVEYLDWGVERATGTTSAELTNIVQQLPPSNDVGYVLDLLGDLDAFPPQTRPGTQLGLLLAPIPVLESFGAADTISADSPPGLRLLSLCRNVSADPWRLESCFAGFPGDA